MDNKYEQKLGTDKMFPLIIRMSLPAVAAQIVNLLYGIVDRIYIGHIPHIGTDALAGVGVTTSVIILIAAFAQFVAGGGAPLCSMALGRGDREGAKRLLGNGFTMLMVFSIAISSLIYLFMKPLLILVGASDATIGYATDYLSVYLLGTFFVEIAIGLNSFINVQGRPMTAMLSIVIGAVINIVLDPIFIFVLHMGVKGAAIATVISQGCSALWILLFLTSGRASLRLGREYIKPRRKTVLPMLALGISPFIMASTESLVGFVLNSSLRDYGDIYVSALTVMRSALQMVSIPTMGFAQGFMPVLSYNYGRGNKERLKQGFKISFIIMVLSVFIPITAMILFPAPIAKMFTNDAALIKTVCRMLPIFLAGMTIFGLQRVCQHTFVALGQAKISVFIAMLRKLFLLIPLAFILPRFMGMGVTGVYAAEAVADASAAIICTLIFMRKFSRILSKMR